MTGLDTKIGVVLRDDLPTWQKLNAAAFLVSGIAATAPESVGAPYEDARDRSYLPMFVQPLLIFAAPMAPTPTGTGARNVKRCDRVHIRR